MRLAGASRADRIKAMSAQKPDYCGKCGYELTGLPSVGNCPECGQAYRSRSAADADDRDAWRAAGSTVKRSWIARHARSVLLVVAAVPVLLCSGLLSVVVSNNQYVLVTGSLLTFLILLGAVISYFFERLE